MWRVAAVGGALVVLGVDWPAAHVERWYGLGLFPRLQTGLTGLSNLVPFALLDVVVAACVAGLVACAVRVMRAAPGRRWRAVGRATIDVSVAVALGCLAFAACWGLNYQRDPITARLDFDPARITPQRAAALANQAVVHLSRLTPQDTATDQGPDESALAITLAPAFDAAIRSVGLPGGTRLARPKTSMLDPYLVRAGISGMTDPFFLETIIATNVLPFERPAVMAHEWAHLAGVARESDASFLGWLVCIHADVRAQYSGWLDLLLRVAGSLDADQRRLVMTALPARVRRDIEAMRRRDVRDQVHLVNLVAWRAYDSYLKTNRVANGIASYNDVVRVVLGTRFEDGWMPAVKPAVKPAGGQEP